MPIMNVKKVSTKMEQKCQTSYVSKIDSNKIDLSIIPVSKDKIPFSEWKNHQKTIAPLEEWQSHYKQDGFVGIITGAVSQNLEVIDIDLKNDPNHRIARDYFKQIPDALRTKLIIVKTINSGYHVIYRCPGVVIEGNQKLALHTNGEVIIETRGEGGYICSNKTKYKTVQGIFDLENLKFDIPVITKEEREFLLETARSLTRYFKAVNTESNSKPFVYNEAAINQFNSEVNIEAFLRNDWQITQEDDEKFYLLRNGSFASHSGYYFKETRVFYCFSTSTAFIANKPYNNFQVLQVLEGGNDYRTTLNLLSKLGFHVETSITKDKISDYDIADHLNDIGIRYDTFRQDLTLNGKIIEELDYNTVYLDMKIHFQQEIPRSRFEVIIKSRYIKVFDPVREFINKNIDLHPSGTFERWADCICLQNQDINKGAVLLFMKKWYVGMIAQALDAEFPNEFFLALLGIIQGIGKSTFLRNYILPKELSDYRVEHSLTFDDDFKVIMGQALLIIDDEMDGRTYESAQTFKNVLSQKTMTTRRKYDRRISTIRRRCSFAGSGNNLNIIRESQNRRIIPIEIASLDWEALEKINYTELFMEAYHLYESGFKYSYQASEKTQLDALYIDYIQKSDVELMLEEQLELPKTEQETEFMSTIKIVSLLAQKYPQFVRRINPITVGKLMNDRGFRSTRQGVQRISGYLISCRSQIKLLDPNTDLSTLFGHKSTQNNSDKSVTD